MVFLPLVVYGVLFGLYAVQRQIVLEDPLTLCLWVGLPGLKEQAFTPERKEQLNRLVTNVPGLSGWYFFHEIDIFFGLLQNPPRVCISDRENARYKGSRSAQADVATIGHNLFRFICEPPTS